jgi:phosphoribosylformylglycinamidine (FGAM) synthase-like amidotransferase family enzyme
MWTLTNNKDWKNLEEQFDFVSDMKGVLQDPIHHAEGDVAVHTQMVLQALEKLEQYRQLL